MSDVEMIPKYRFDEVNDRKKELEDRVKALEAQVKSTVPSDRVKELEAQLAQAEKQAAVAEKLSTQVEELKAKNKQIVESHEAELATRAKHDVLRDKGIQDPEVRDLFLSKLGDVEDVGEAIESYYAEDAEVPSVLKPFLPERQPEGESEDPPPQGAQNRTRKADPISRSQRGRTAPPAYDARQIDQMTADEYEAHRAQIYRSAGLPVPPDSRGSSDA